MVTRTGRYEYQFQGRVPAVRKGQYQDANDYQFLIMDEEGWLFKIPVCLAAAAETEIEKIAARDEKRSQESSAIPTAMQIAAAQLRAGLENYRPRQNTAYAELDRYFAVDVERARELAASV